MFKAIRETFGIKTAAEKAEEEALEEYGVASSRVHHSWNKDFPPDEEDLKAWRIAADFQH